MLGGLTALVLLIIVGTWIGVARLQKALETSQANLRRAEAAERDTEREYLGALLLGGGGGA
jgi:hypothetical protein